MKKSYKIIFWILSSLIACFISLNFADHALAFVALPEVDTNKIDSLFDRSFSSPDLPSAVTDPTVIPTFISISSARLLADGESVFIRGKVTALPSVLSNQYFYIQDETAGIQIYSYYKNFPDMVEGDMIEVRGILSAVSNERRIKISEAADVSIIEKGAKVSKDVLNISEVGEKHEGEYIEVSGIVSKTSGSTFFLQDETGSTVEVIIRSGTGIKKPRMSKGERVVVGGIVSQYKDSYRILPINQEDVKILSSAATLPLAGPEINYFYIALAIYLLWNLLVKTKEKAKIWLKKSLDKLNRVTFLP